MAVEHLLEEVEGGTAAAEQVLRVEELPGLPDGLRVVAAGDVLVPGGE